MDMKVLVVGGGGREHAITRALSCNSGVRIFSVMARKNPGIARLAERVLLEKETNIAKIEQFAVENGLDAAVIGPETPLEAGIVDRLEAAGIPSLGPTRAAARLETDKAFCRRLMERHGIAGCPEYRVFHDPEEAREFIEAYDGDLAVKPIGLTGGKGVRIMGEHVDAAGAVEYAREIGGDVVLEERLIGEEFTLQAFVDGKHLVPMPLVQDHKRAYEGDVGPNTGGMGSYSMPDHMFPFVTRSDYDKALRIMEDTVAAMQREGTPYRGILYGQFMNTRDGPRVIEFNARFGDPEAMNVLSLLESDLSEIVGHVAEGSLSPSHVRFARKATVCKYLVPEGYPDAPAVGEPLALGDYGDALLYYASVEERDGTLYTQTSRTLAFVGMGETLEEAEAIAETAASSVRGRTFHRRDIGTRAVLEKRCRHMKEIA
ncbi:phosphoribosylamine--glycine ligase [Methanoculleus sp. Wushi-C6]|uniref:Phosphoribosylamine--glycine ligase n=1 Tax=Methanoculleus caldifontis TaxID=2651577 RepID=A0ABU3X2I0_9EURY|nr:phosphoribosylamine--glycine ligase [Methanoculleus sp. Wushi-C6]MDV2482283.1 phosphoribosylamine--glycine ligase [Methanoculleus sp. Wushi-C6]